MSGVPNRWGVLKSANDVTSFFFNTVACIYSQKTLGLNMGGAKLVFLHRAPVNLDTPGSHFPSLALAPELIFFLSLPKI